MKLKKEVKIFSFFVKVFIKLYCRVPFNNIHISQKIIIITVISRTNFESDSL